MACHPGAVAPYNVTWVGPVEDRARRPEAEQPMHKANAERLRREQSAATVTNLASIGEQAGRIEAKLDRVLELLAARGAGEPTIDVETPRPRKASKP
jgi:hypothetical protein